MRRLAPALVLTSFFVALGGACSNGGVTLATAPGPVDASVVIDTGLPPGVGVGQACADSTPCRAGLACQAGKCAPGHSLPAGTPCVLNAECATGDYCGPDRKCDPAGSGKDGDACKSDADCGGGLRCDLVGLSAQCKPEGAGDVGGACKSSADCFGGLGCASGVCAPLPQLPPGQLPPIGLPSWKGETCKDDPAPTKAYFRVPRGSDDGDFFRLPFPNDVRRKGGHLDLSGFPTPGTDLVGFDLVDRYARDLEANADGFSTYPTVTMRFSGGINFDSLKGQGVVRWVDLTAGAGGNDLGFGWSATTGRNQYVCENALSIRPQMGHPLTPGSTYGVFLTTGATASGGAALARGDDFAAMLGASAPSDATLAAAYVAYKPFRDWLTAKSVSPDTVLTAAVFTVGHADKPATKLAAAIAAGAVPTVANWVKCGGADPSPCPQATGDRACGAADPAFDELHALVSLPVFQKGTAPYETPADGGDFVYDGQGVPQVQRTEAVCMALTVPKGTTGPIPLVIYAHGTGGSFRSHVTDGVAARLASIDDGAGGKVHAAVLGIDQVEHGPRRGASQASPNDLFYNFANPGAARGNPLQGAADQLSLVRFAKALDLSAAASPTGAALKFGAIAFWGHSQGATEGAVAMPYVPGPVGVVLSGEGASLIDALLSKKSPVDIADVVPLVLEDPGNVSATHPVLSLLQNAVDVADPLNHARSLAASPVTGVDAKHTLQPYGLGDTYAPPVTEATYAIAAGLGLATHDSSVTTPDAIGDLTETAVPASGNLGTSPKLVTAFVREYAPGSSYDGHFVVYQQTAAMADVDHFLADALGGKVPKVGR